MECHIFRLLYCLFGDFTQSKQPEENAGVITYYVKCFIVKMRQKYIWLYLNDLKWFCFRNDVIYKFSLL